MTGTATMLRADTRALPLPDASVDLIVTSPPYWSQRSYTDGGAHYDGQIGDEATPAEYVSNLIDATREWMRVLKPSGSIFVNLGDKYNSAASGQNGTGSTTLDPGRGPKMYEGARGAIVKAVRPKSLLLLPERYRIGCVDELGLIARAVVIWSKPNGMPESVTDRVRRSHEDWVHLVKEPRYYSAIDEIREPSNPRNLRPGDVAGVVSAKDQARRSGGAGVVGHVGKPLEFNPLGKLPGSVWEVATEPLKVPAELGVDHFAAFPSEWPRRIILGWSPSGVCIACGEGRRPIVDRALDTSERPNGYTRSRGARDLADDGRRPNGSAFGVGPSMRGRSIATITGETCACPEAIAPTSAAVVLDPFGGTGTTALVAKALGRHGISADRSADYCRLAEWRTNDSGQLAKAMRVAAPPKEFAGQVSLFDEMEASA